MGVQRRGPDIELIEVSCLAYSERGDESCQTGSRGDAGVERADLLDRGRICVVDIALLLGRKVDRVVEELDNSASRMA